MTNRECNWENVREFKQTGSVTVVKITLRASLHRSDVNVAAVRENVAEIPDTSIEPLQDNVTSNFEAPYIRQFGARVKTSR